MELEQERDRLIEQASEVIDSWRAAEHGVGRSGRTTPTNTVSALVDAGWRPPQPDPEPQFNAWGQQVCPTCGATAGLEIDHLCGVRGCINPKHLETVTPEENRRRALSRHRKLSDDDIRAIRRDPRGPRMIAEERGLSHSTVSDIKRGRSWKDVPDQEAC